MRERERGIDGDACDVTSYGMRELNPFLRFALNFSAFCTVKIDSRSVSPVARRAFPFRDPIILPAQFECDSGEWKYPAVLFGIIFFPPLARNLFLLNPIGIPSLSLSFSLSAAILD